MFCGNCGAQLDDSFRACPRCGAPVQRQQTSAAYNPTYIDPRSNPKPVLVFGILSLSFSLTFFLSFLGTIFGIVGLVKAKAYNNFTGNVPSKQVTIGRRLSLAGLIVGSIITGYFLFYMIGFIGILASY